MRILTGRVAGAAVLRLSNRARTLSSFEPKVKKIVNDVRRGGEPALRRYSEQWDALGKRQPLQLSKAELKTAWLGTSRELRKAPTIIIIIPIIATAVPRIGINGGLHTGVVTCV